jgi:uncharacterized protein YdcH (DUF465 family)
MSLSDNILLDQEEFNKASNDLAQLSGDLAVLRGKVELMLDTLKSGFDTPAGRKFHKSCEANLITPLNKQKLVLDHISEVLRTANTRYQSVFDAYQELNNAINF